MTDPIADLLTRIRNAYLAHLPEVVVPYSSQKQALAKILHQAGYLEAVTTSSNHHRQFLKLTLRYFKGIPAITGSRRESTPGRRVYKRTSELPRVLGGQGLAIVSTSQGIITAKEAKKRHLGGELICTIW